MLTKEEILDEAGYDVYYYGDGRKNVLAALGKYAQQQAIAFAEWIYENRLTHDKTQNFGWEWFYQSGETIAKNTEQLYQLFIQSKKQ